MEIIKSKEMPKIKNRGRKLLYPFDKIKVGGCLMLSDKDNVTSIKISAYQYAERNGLKFEVRTENNKTGIYRTK